MSRIFNQYFSYHRKLLQEGIANHPQHFNRSDLEVYDGVVASLKKELIRENLIGEWQPAFYLKNPLQFLTLTKQQVLCEVYFTKKSGATFLSEDIRADVPPDSALYSHAEALGNLEDFYDNLDSQNKRLLNQAAIDHKKINQSFKFEIDDLSDELRAIFGKLDKSGFFKKLLDKTLGLGARATAKIFGVGKIEDTTIAEQVLFSSGLQPLHEKVPFVGTFLTPQNVGGIENAIRTVLSSEKINILPRGVVEKIAANFGVGINDVANVAHHIGANVPGTLGTITPIPTAAATTATTAAAPTATTAAATTATAATPTATTAATTATAPKITSATAGKGLFAKLAGKLAGMSLGAKLGLAAGVGALGIAGIGAVQMKKRATRIKRLLNIARDFKGELDNYNTSTAGTTPPTSPFSYTLNPSIKENKKNPKLADILF